MQRPEFEEVPQPTFWEEWGPVIGWGVVFVLLLLATAIAGGAA